MTYTAKNDTSFTIGAVAQDGTSSFSIPDGEIVLASGTLASTATTFTIDNIDNAPFPDSGTLLITDGSGNTEQVSYTGIYSCKHNWTTLPQPTATDLPSEITFTGVTRGANGTTALATFRW